MSVTERIRKPAAGSELPADIGDEAPATDVLAKAPTEFEMAALCEPPVPASQTIRWLVIVLLAVLIGIGAAIAWMGT